MILRFAVMAWRVLLIPPMLVGIAICYLCIAAGWGIDEANRFARDNSF